MISIRIVGPSARMGCAGLALALLGCTADPPPSRDNLMPGAGMTGLPTGGTVATGGGGTGGVRQPSLPTAGTSGASAGSSGATAGAGAGASAGGAAGEAGASGAAGGAGVAGAPICDDDAGVPTDEDGGVPDCNTVGDVRLQYKAADTNATDNGIKPHFKVINDGNAAVALAELTIRYWYTLEAPGPNQVFWCDYAQLGCGTIQGSFVAEPRMGATHYLQVGFTSGSLAAGANTGEIQTRFNKEDWSALNEADDYSFDPTKTAFADWSKVTLYQRGMLIWGQEPPAP